MGPRPCQRGHAQREQQADGDHCRRDHQVRHVAGAGLGAGAATGPSCSPAAGGVTLAAGAAATGAAAAGSTAASDSNVATRPPSLTPISAATRCATVIAATGPWTRPLLQKIGCDLPIETEYHQVAILKNAPEMKGGGCACIDSGTQTYFRPDGQDKFLVGDFYGQRPVDPDNFPQRASDESLGEVIERACGRVPKLENAEVMRGVTGVYDMTPDSRPLLGE